jgi:rRNA small subunit pseudouridine methyltransferase Nep1
MLTLVLADAELELVPQEVQGHPSVRAHARRRGRSPSAVLLDSSFHHPALRALPDGSRRGRPDIVHFFLVIALDSIANIEGQLETVVHTRHDQVLRCRPDTRIPKSYSRFVGLMEELLTKGAVPPEGEPLLRLESLTLGGFLARAPRPAVVLHEAGARHELEEVFAGRDEATVVVGGFPQGDFLHPPPGDLPRISLHGHPLKAWTAASEVLTAWRRSRPRRGPRTMG